MSLGTEVRDWWQEPQNIERITTDLNELVTLLRKQAGLSVKSTATAKSVSAAGGVPNTLSIADFWIVGPGATDTTIPLRLARDPSVSVTLSATLTTLLNGMVVVFFTGPDTGWVTTISAATTGGVLTVDSVGYAPQEGNRIQILSSTAAATTAVTTQYGNTTDTGNTVTIPDGINVNIDVPGQFSQNTITIQKNGTGLPTTIQANSMLGSNVSLMEGDTFVADSMVASSVVSSNTAGGLTATSGEYTSISYSNPGTSAGTFTVGFSSGQPLAREVFLQAGGSGTVDIYFNAQGGVIGGTLQLDNGPITSYSSLAGTITLTIPNGSHVLHITFDTDYPPGIIGAYIATFSSWSNGNIVEALTAPSYVRLGNMAHSGIIIDGDSIVVNGNDIANSQIINKSSDITGSNIVVESNLSDSHIFWFSKVDLTVGSMHDATITVPFGVSGTTTIHYSGEVAEDLTTTTSQTVWVGTDLIPNYTAPSSNPTVVQNDTADIGFVASGEAAGYDTLTVETYFRVDGSLLVNDLVVAAGATVTVGSQGQITTGAFN